MEKQEGGQRATGRDADARPKVSIVTVVFNGAASLERTIQSVLGQGLPDIEYLIIDGGSTDGTLDIIRRYDDRLAYWVSEKDKGIYDAMNKGIALCRGEWVGMINADDAYADGAVGMAMDEAAKHPGANIIHGDISIHYPNGGNKVKRAKLSGFLLKYWEMVLNHPSFFVRRSYYAEHPFDPAFRVSGDHLWTLRAWLEDPAQFVHVPQVLAHFSAGGASMTIPLGKVLRESDRMSDALGYGFFQRWLAKFVRTALYLPVIAKLRFNQFVAHLHSK